jgi:hypothetical protein
LIRREAEVVGRIDASMRPPDFVGREVWRELAVSGAQGSGGAGGNRTPHHTAQGSTSAQQGANAGRTSIDLGGDLGGDLACGEPGAPPPRRRCCGYRTPSRSPESRKQPHSAPHGLQGSTSAQPGANAGRTSMDLGGDLVCGEPGAPPPRRRCCGYRIPSRSPAPPSRCTTGRRSVPYHLR